MNREPRLQHDRNRRRLAVEGLEDRRLLAQLFVTTPADAGPGSLREAIAIANQNGEDDSIVLEPAAFTETIRLESPLTIGEAGFSVDIRGFRGRIDGQGQSRVLDIDDGDDAQTSSVRLQSLFVTGGSILSGSGGGIRNREALVLDSVFVEGNEAHGTATGAGIANHRSITMIRSSVTENVSVSHGAGLVNHSAATMSIQVSDVIGNFIQATGTGTAPRGAGIHNAGTLILGRSTIADNQIVNMDAWEQTGDVGGYGAGIANEATGDVRAVGTMNSIRNNQNTDGNGGGIANWGRLLTTFGTLEFVDNQAGIAGGGLWNGTGAFADLEGDRFENNRAGGEEPIGFPTPVGGGIAHVGGELFVTDLTFLRNRAFRPLTDTEWAGLGGAVFASGDGLADIASSTLERNGDEFFGESTATGGGAIAVDERGSVMIRDTVFLRNRAGSGGAMLALRGGELHLFDSSIDNNAAEFGSAVGLLGGNADQASVVLLERVDVLGNSEDAAIRTDASDSSGAIGAELYVRQSSVRNNESQNGGAGIAIGNFTEFAIENSTISGNQARESGGGINIHNPNGSVLLQATTLANNSSDSEGGGLYLHAGDIDVVASILTGNTSGVGGPDLHVRSESGTYLGNVSLTESLVSVNTDSGLPRENGPNFVGDPQNPIDAALIPLLNGAAFLPSESSPARDGAPSLTLTIDQFGNPRPLDAAPDMGAVEDRVPDPPICDVDFDGLCDCDDIRVLGEAIVSGSADPIYDLNNDGAVDIGDRDTWLTEYALEVFGRSFEFLKGDANLDLSVDVSDFNVWNAHKFQPGGWCEGDFNTDGVVDVSDFGYWSSNKFTISPGRVGLPGTPLDLGGLIPEQDDSDRPDDRSRLIDRVFETEAQRDAGDGWLLADPHANLASFRRNFSGFSAC